VAQESAGSDEGNWKSCWKSDSISMWGSWATWLKNEGRRGKIFSRRRPSTSPWTISTTASIPR
jgi:hypothetical protein